jgi:phage shock protein A
MNDLFKKLNTLVKASLNDALGDSRSSGERRRLSPERLGKDIDREVAMLRQKINDALAYEDELMARVNTLQAEVAKWDEQADQAVASGDDAGARYAIDQMNRAQQRQAMAESDLNEHRLVTQELISRVNTLDAAVADARRAQADDKTDARESSEIGQPAHMLSDVLRDAREKISQMGEMVSAKAEVPAPSPAAEPQPDKQAVEDDLEARRQRLSKK